MLVRGSRVARAAKLRAAEGGQEWKEERDRVSAVARRGESQAGGDVGRPGSAVIAGSAAEREVEEVALGEAKRRSSIVLAIVSVLREAERAGKVTEVVERGESCAACGAALETSWLKATSSRIE